MADIISADYAFYQETFHGTASEGDFDRLGVEATAYLDTATNGRALEEQSSGVNTKINLAYCKLIDTLLFNEQGGTVASETNDGISVNYVNTTKSDNQRLYEAVVLFLGNTGLLYRGVL